MTSKEYIKMLEDSLVKKVELLKQLQGLNLEQREILEDYEDTDIEYYVNYKDQPSRKLSFLS